MHGSFGSFADRRDRREEAGGRAMKQEKGRHGWEREKDLSRGRCDCYRAFGITPIGVTGAQAYRCRKPRRTTLINR